MTAGGRKGGGCEGGRTKEIDGNEGKRVTEEERRWRRRKGKRRIMKWNVRGGACLVCRPFTASVCLSQTCAAAITQPLTALKLLLSL